MNLQSNLEEELILTDSQGVEIVDVGVVNPRLIKFGTPLVHHLLSTKDMFSLITTKSQMENLAYAKEARAKFLSIAEKDGGDLHYFKKQSFHTGHKRVVNYKINYLYFI